MIDPTKHSHYFKKENMLKKHFREDKKKDKSSLPPH